MCKLIGIAAIAASFVLVSTCAGAASTRERLQSMQMGVWVSSGGGYVVWTPNHYFVVTASGDSSAANIYCGASQVAYTDHGIARKQNLRLRQFGTAKPAIYHDFAAFQNSSDSSVIEEPLQFNPALFDTTKCVTDKGVIYDSIVKETADYILMVTCNGDHIKLYNNGREAYLPASGGVAWWYRIEELK